MLVQLDDSHNKVHERRCLEVAYEALDDRLLALDEREHLHQGPSPVTLAAADANHLGGLLGEEHGIDLGEVRGHCHLRLHIARRAVEHGDPERREELVRVRHACLDDRPYLAAEHFCGNVRIPG